MLASRRNVKWMAHDATELELPAASFDVVFSNWLLMYLSDDEVSKLAADTLRWVSRLAAFLLPGPASILEVESISEVMTLTHYSQQGYKLALLHSRTTA